MQRGQRLQLPAVVIRVIVHFAQQHCRALGSADDDFGFGYFSPPGTTQLPTGAQSMVSFSLHHFRLRRGDIQGSIQTSYNAPEADFRMVFKLKALSSDEFISTVLAHHP